MFGDLLGGLQKKQEELKAKLKEVEIVEQISDGAITVTVNAARELLNVEINPELVDLTDKTQIEDLVVIVVNNALEKAAMQEAEMSQSLMTDMLPPGMENLLGS